MDKLLAQGVRGSRTTTSINTNQERTTTSIERNQNSLKVGSGALSQATSNILFVVFIGALLLYLVMSGVLWYHWKNYNLGEREVIITQVAYLVCTGILLLIALFSIV
jgi:hypothetical protein